MPSWYLLLVPRTSPCGPSGYQPPSPCDIHTFSYAKTSQITAGLYSTQGGETPDTRDNEALLLPFLYMDKCSLMNVMWYFMGDLGAIGFRDYYLEGQW